MIAENSGSSRIASKSGSSRAFSLEDGVGFDRLAQVLERVLLAAQQALGAGEVVEEPGMARGLGEQALVDLDRLLVILVREVDDPFRRPLPRRGGERLARLPADDHDRRPSLLGDSPALRGGIADEDERSCRRVDLVAVDGERRVAARHEVQLLVLARVLAELVVLADDVHARLLADVRVDTERLDVEVRSHHRPRLVVGELERELGDVRGAAHEGKSGRSRRRSKSESSAAYSSACGSSSIARFNCSIAASSLPVSASKQAAL